ncbi:MAG: STT3 domain-containing protein [Myxococcota bacterium]
MSEVRDESPAPVRPRELLGYTALLLLAFALRVLPWRWQLESGRVHFHGNDAYYHARRILYSVSRLPEALHFDPYLNFPHGGEPIWPPFFDLGIAGIVRVLAGPDAGAQSVEWISIWIPPLLAVLTVALVALTARLTLGRTESFVAGTILAILPAHFTVSRIGFVDHHVAVSLAFVSLLFATLGAIRCWSEPRASLRSPLAWAVLLGSVIAGCLLLWPGMLLHLAIVEVPLGVRLATLRTPRELRRVALWLFVAHGLAAAMLAPAALGRTWSVWGSFSPLVLSDFQPWLLAGLAVGYGLCAWVLPLPRIRVGSGRRLGVALLLLLAVLGGMSLLTSGVSEATTQAVGWLAKQERFQSAVSESRPLLMERGRPSLAFALTQLSGLLLLLPVFFFTARDAVRPKGPRARSVATVAFSTGVLLCVTLVQARFIACLAVSMSLLVGACTPALWTKLSRQLGPGLLARGVALLLPMLVFLPCLWIYGPFLQDPLRFARGLEPELGQRLLRRRMLISVADWIREHTPPTSSYFEAEQTPEYGILAPWTDGHVLRYVGQRPVVVDNFGDDAAPENFELAREYYRSGEPRGSRILDELRARFVLLEYRAPLGDVLPRSLLSRLYFGDGQGSRDSVVVRNRRARRVPVAVPAVARHRLVHESPPKRFGATPELPGFKLYEHVAGARLEGRADPAARVEASLRVRTNQGRSFRFLAATHADPQGCWEIRFPYPTAGWESEIGTAAEVEIRSGDALRRVGVPESAVVEGGVIHVPDLGTSSPGGCRRGS